MWSCSTNTTNYAYIYIVELRAKIQNKVPYFDKKTQHWQYESFLADFCLNGF